MPAFDPRTADPQDMLGSQVGLYDLTVRVDEDNPFVHGVEQTLKAGFTLLQLLFNLLAAGDIADAPDTGDGFTRLIS